ncbi:hypothetical protein VNO77_33959 [Canavalia gladiata]|uniref:Uncharacterized protein n=1 Tax=Canavalia gladiata TaxID=3824 RepID=A0AAN9KFB5_CANGL
MRAELVASWYGKRKNYGVIDVANVVEETKGSVFLGFESPTSLVARITMSLACLVCHSVDSPSPSHSFRSYSVSSSENEGRCSAVATCLTRKLSLPPPTAHSFLAPSSTSKVTPQPTGSSNNLIPGTPRLVRSHAITRDRVRNWNFDELVMES